MDYKKKYEEVLEKAKQWHKDGYGHGCQEVMEDLFPELKESKGEKIRKHLIGVVELYYGKTDEQEKKDCLAWLEKQGEQNPCMIQWKGDNLKEIIDFTGVYKEGFEKWFHNSWEEYETYVHEHNNIFKIFNEDGSHMEVPVGAWIIKAPDGYNTASRFAISPILTELSIESNFKFKKAIEAIENYVNSFPHSQRPEIWQHINFLKSLKATPKQQWSEEDECCRKQLIIFCENCMVQDSNSKKCADWLKSLRPQSYWRPSKEHIMALRWVLNNVPYNRHKEEISGLLEQIKDL